MFRVIVPSVVICVLTGSAGAQDKSAILKKTLSPGVFEAAILEMRMPDDAMELMARFARAVGQDPEWTREYIAAHSDLKPGEPLPWHKNFGLTENEYARLVAAKKETKLVPTARCKLIVKSKEDGRMLLSGTGRAAVLNGLTIDGRTMTIRYKDLSSKDCAVVRPKKTALVAIHGLDWNTENFDSPSDVSALSLTVGRHTKSQKGFLEFRATKASGGVPSVLHHLYLEWQPKSSETR